MKGVESVTTPAGTFEAYRAELTGSEQPLTFYIQTTAPHQVVKVAVTGLPLEFLRAR